MVRVADPLDLCISIGGDMVQGVDQGSDLRLSLGILEQRYQLIQIVRLGRGKDDLLETAPSASASSLPCGPWGSCSDIIRDVRKVHLHLRPFFHRDKQKSLCHCWKENCLAIGNCLSLARVGREREEDRRTCCTAPVRSSGLSPFVIKPGIFGKNNAYSRGNREADDSRRHLSEVSPVWTSWTLRSCHQAIGSSPVDSRRRQACKRSPSTTALRS